VFKISKNSRILRNF